LFLYNKHHINSLIFGSFREEKKALNIQDAENQLKNISNTSPLPPFLLACNSTTYFPLTKRKPLKFFTHRHLFRILNLPIIHQSIKLHMYKTLSNMTMTMIRDETTKWSIGRWSTPKTPENSNASRRQNYFLIQLVQNRLYDKRRLLRFSRYIHLHYGVPQTAYSRPPSHQPLSKIHPTPTPTLRKRVGGEPPPPHTDP